MFFPGLRSRSADAASPLPEGYSGSDWEHGRYLYRSHGLDLGVIVCSSCGARRKHCLDWPNEAFYQVQHRGSRLWAFHRESAIDPRHVEARQARHPCPSLEGVLPRFEVAHGGVVIFLIAELTSSGLS